MELVKVLYAIPIDWNWKHRKYWLCTQSRIYCAAESHRWFIISQTASRSFSLPRFFIKILFFQWLIRFFPVVETLQENEYFNSTEQWFSKTFISHMNETISSGIGHLTVFRFAIYLCTILFLDSCSLTIHQFFSWLKIKAFSWSRRISFYYE